MSLNFSSYPFASYQGKIASQAYQRLGRSGSIVAFNVAWSSYSFGGQSLGQSVPNFVVLLNFQGQANVPQPFAVASVFIDNTGSAVPLYLYFPDTGYTVTVAPNSQGWFPVISNAPVAWLVGTNFANSADLPTTFVAFTDLFITPYVNASIPESANLLLASPVIALAGAGGSVTSINAVGGFPAGSCYTSGALTITGNGSSASAQGSLDAYGRFAAVTIIDGGEDYTIVPSVIASGAQSAPPAYSSTTYPAGTQLSYNGTIWLAEPEGGAAGISTSANALPANTNVVQGAQYLFNGTIYQTSRAFFTSFEPVNYWVSQGYMFAVATQVPLNGAGWTNTGIAINEPAEFTASISPVGTPTSIVGNGYSVQASGDQVINVNGMFTANGSELSFFTTPAANGFYYITNLTIDAYNYQGQVLASVELVNQFVQALISTLVICSDGTTKTTRILDLSNCNIKIDATKVYTLVCTSFAGYPFGLTVNGAYTYSEQ